MEMSLLMERIEANAHKKPVIQSVINRQAVEEAAQKAILANARQLVHIGNAGYKVRGSIAGRCLAEWRANPSDTVRLSNLCQAIAGLFNTPEKKEASEQLVAFINNLPNVGKISRRQLAHLLAQAEALS